MNLTFIHASYLIATALFILGLRGLCHATTARRGMMLAALGMIIAVVGTLFHQDIVKYHWIILGLVVGTLVGIPMGLWIPMTKMPERIALSHSFGGLAVALVGVVEYYRHMGHLSMFQMGTTGFEVLLGALTFTGSLMAFGKLQGILPGRPQTFKGQNVINLFVLAAALALTVVLIFRPEQHVIFYAMLALSFLFGILLVIPIGGADMPVVICLLNSYAGLAAAATGFALQNSVLITCGALDGGSGFILAMLMSRAMNRSFGNVIFGAFGTVAATAKSDGEEKPIHASTVDDVVEYLRMAGSVVMVPGYGLAVAQAQHVVRELGELLEKNGTEVRYAIHPVAGRMPGHMNVLLAEANVPYEELVEMESINPSMASVDVVIVIGANDVVNPAALEDKSSPIWGMPIIEVHKSKTVFVLKRSMAAGFAGIENPLFHKENTRMVFGDAKQTIQQLVAKFKES